MKKRRYRRLVFALALIALAGMLWSAAILARTGPAASTHAFALKSATSLFRSVFTPASPTSSTHNITLSKARVSTLVNNRSVIVMETGGDMPGVLTLAVDVKSDGTVSGGEWALVSTEADEAHGAHPDQNEAGESHRSDAMTIQKGVLKGSVSSGTVSLSANGTIASVNSIQLAVNGGSLVFDGISSGDGIAHGANLDDSQSSSGSLTLNF